MKTLGTELMKNWRTMQDKGWRNGVVTQDSTSFNAKDQEIITCWNYNLSEIRSISVAYQETKKYGM